MKPTFRQMRWLASKIKPRSKWDKAVKAYVYDLIDELTERYRDMFSDKKCPRSSRKFMAACCPDRDSLRTLILNGARNFVQFSEGGQSLIYNVAIAKRLYTPSRLKRLHYDKKTGNVDFYLKRGGFETNLLIEQGYALTEAFVKLCDLLGENYQ